MSAALPTLIAVLAGIALGLTGGGSFDNLRRWRPVAWQLAAGGIAIQLLFRLLPLSGTFAVVLDVISMLLLIATAVLNIHVAGMVVIVVGLVLNVIPTVINNGTPVSPDALVSAGLVEPDQLDQVELEGPRHVQTEDDSLAWLGETIAIPSGQVISLGDIILLLGEMLTISALLRNRRIGRSSRPRSGQAARGRPPQQRGSKPRSPQSRPPQSRSAQARTKPTNTKPGKRPPPEELAPNPSPTRAKAAAKPTPQPKPKPARAVAPTDDGPEPAPRAPTRRGSSKAPRIRYEDAVAGLSDPDPATGRTGRRRTRREAADDFDDEVDLRDESLKHRP